MRNRSRKLSTFNLKTKSEVKLLKLYRKTTLSPKSNSLRNFRKQKKIYKREVKAWRRELGQERKINMKLEEKLIKLGSETESSETGKIHRDAILDPKSSFTVSMTD